MSPAGWPAEAHQTIVIVASSGTAGFGDIGFADGPSAEAPLPSASAPSDQATVSVLDVDRDLPQRPGIDLVVDGACTRSLDTGDPNGPTVIAEGHEWALAAGSHTLGLVTAPPGSGLTTDQCAAAAAHPVATATVTASAGQRIDVVVRGADAAHLSLLVAPVS